ncbi:MAG TPA: LacI family DNA-binding transcriptional regulator [Niabella sp.]|nr:LacI family DNA-binding transcriptional regulator [Niabella sp.]HOZ96483.1 LacI family DNA-binding transcriptional regulator [Niabella sp.]HQW13336.1 LacI family DNA-binding transcriptional regulator [Niabella sp.]HQX18624.1 LacI family DNA-binding transcriptional regulator [Niabella sp.]HQX42260.1 LacI family DNA-binding transcriptional regulator [Niabella sp.]
MSKINLEMIARELNLSVATVSKALNDSHEISSKTKKRVLDKAKELNYQANPLASALRNKKTHTIAVVFPEIDNNFFALAIKGVEHIAFAKGYHLLIYPTNENYQREKAILNLLQNGRVDGIMISLSTETKDIKHIEHLIEEGLPVVLFDRVNYTVQAPKVITDDFESAYLATKHLINVGCKKIAFLSSSAHLYINKKRLDGYKKALYDNHINVEKSLIVQCTNNDIENQNIISKALLENPPEAIIASIEKLIVPCLRTCKDLHLNIPHDIKLIGYSNSHIDEFLKPSLSAIVQPAFEIGKEAASILLQLIDKKYKKSISENVILPSKICVRESTSIS